MRKWAQLSIIVVLLLTVAVACAPQQMQQPEVVEKVVTATPEPGETTFERAMREGVVRVGFANENPYAYVTEEAKLTGEAVEVARAVFQNLGIEEMEGIVTEFGSLIPGLNANRFDVVTAGMYITPKRCEQVLFADPEYKISGGLIVEAGNPHDLHSYEDIAANPDVKVGTGAGYLEHDYMIAVGVSEDQIVTYPDNPSGMAGLRAGQIDAYTATAPALQTVLETTGDPNFELADPFTDPVIDGQPVTNYGGAAFRFEDRDFREAFNEELTKLKESGELLEILSQFPGFGRHTLPGDVTAEDICPEQYE